jgi:flagellar hook-basal body complex protein FliE
MDIQSITSINNLPQTERIQSNKPASGLDQVAQSFGQVLDSLNQSQQESDSLMTKLSTGQDVDLHQVMIASEENDVNFRVALAIRDKLVEAYRSVMQMSV